MTVKQVEQLEQLVVRNAMRVEGFAYLLQFVIEKPEIVLTETERKEIQSKLMSIDERTRKSIRSVNEQIEVSIAEELTPTQKETFKSVIGPFFEYTPVAVQATRSSAFFPE
ncbi:MAG: hypothetical protein R3C56_37595 [Pirellulaceae bacterium]